LERTLRDVPSYSEKNRGLSEKEGGGAVFPKTWIVVSKGEEPCSVFGKRFGIAEKKKAIRCRRVKKTRSWQEEKKRNAFLPADGENQMEWTLPKKRGRSARLQRKIAAPHPKGNHAPGARKGHPKASGEKKKRSLHQKRKFLCSGLTEDTSSSSKGREKSGEVHREKKRLSPSCEEKEVSSSSGEERATRWGKKKENVSPRRKKEETPLLHLRGEILSRAGKKRGSREGKGGDKDSSGSKKWWPSPAGKKKGKKRRTALFTPGKGRPVP